MLVGVASAFVIEGVMRYIARWGFDDPALASVILLLAPFAAYLPAEKLHVSGVLAAVSAGLLLSRRSALFIDSETRLVGSSVWRLLTFILNAFAFLLIGLQLPLIVAELVPHVAQYALYGLGLSIVVIAVRFAWVFPAAYLPHALDPALRKREPVPRWQSTAVIAWAGMRGIVSLAAALALPYTLGDQPFPERSGAIFLTFCVICVTLIGQGLTLAPLIERLGVTETSKNQRRETHLRILALQAGLTRLHELQEQHHGTRSTSRSPRAFSRSTSGGLRSYAGAWCPARVKIRRSPCGPAFSTGGAGRREACDSRHAAVRRSPGRYLPLDRVRSGPSRPSTQLTGSAPDSRRRWPPGRRSPRVRESRCPMRRARAMAEAASA